MNDLRLDISMVRHIWETRYLLSRDDGWQKQTNDE